MPNRSLRDVRQNATPLARPTPQTPAPVMAQPMSRPVMTAPIAKPAPIGAPNRGGRSKVPQQLAAGAVPPAASIAAGVQAPNVVAAQPREPLPTMQGPAGPIPRPLAR